jgi:hypothetical protein
MSGTSPPSLDDRDPEALDIEELFATEETDLSLADDDTETQDASESTASRARTTAVGTDPSDTTADELFQQLRSEQGSASTASTGPADPEFDDESPEEIMARADESEPHVDAIDERREAVVGACRRVELASAVATRVGHPVVVRDQLSATLGAIRTCAS